MFSMGLRTLCALMVVAVVAAIYPPDHWTYSTKLTTGNFDATIQAAVDSDKTMLEQIRGNHNPGAGGWPTIRYFNKETGVEGKPYTKKTSKSMCDELGDETYLDEYILEAASIVLCDVSTGAGCTDKESGFLTTWKAKSAEQVAAELERLTKLSQGDAKLKAEAKAWQKNRIKLLTSMTKSSSVTEGSSEL